MAELSLQGPFTLDAQGVREKLTRALAGVYALGHTDGEGIFVVEKIGRSDTDVRQPLTSNVECYTQFAFEHTSSPRAGFEKECLLFHNSLDAKSYIHPTRPEGSYWKCPECHIFD